MEKTILLFRNPANPENVIGMWGNANRHPTAYWTEFLLTRGNKFVLFLEWMHEEHGFEVADAVFMVDLPQK